MKKYIILLAFIFSILCLGNLQANSNIGHNTIGLYCIWKMSTDSSFMPQIQGIDRQELTNPPILKCSEWEDFSNAQKAFLQGVNFPDCIALMEVSHNKAPLEVLAAMYILKDFCPAVYEDKPEEVKAFICRMQKYMTWGAKLHVEMDKITHARLPYAEKQLASHIWIEKEWDLQLRSSIAQEFTDSAFDLENFNKATDVFWSLTSPNFKFNNNSLDIRDDYVDLVLDFYKHGKDLKTNHHEIRSNISKFGDVIIAKFKSGDSLPSNYQYPQHLANLMTNLLSNLDLTIPPTSEEIKNQYNIDLPTEMQNGNFRFGPTSEGQKMLKKARELNRDKVFQLLKLNKSRNTDAGKEEVVNRIRNFLDCTAEYQAGTLLENEKKNLAAIDNLVSEVTREPNWGKLNSTNYNNLSDFLFEEQVNNPKEQTDNGLPKPNEDDPNDPTKQKLEAFLLWSKVSPQLSEDDFKVLKGNKSKVKQVLASCIEKYKHEQLANERINCFVKDISGNPINLSPEEKTLLEMLNISEAFEKLCGAMDKDEQILKHPSVEALCKSDANVAYLLKRLKDPNWLRDGGPFQAMLMESLAYEVDSLQGLYVANKDGKIPGDASNEDAIDQSLKRLKKGIPPQVAEELGLNKKGPEVFDNFNKSSVHELLEENKLETIPYVDYIPEGVENPNYFLRFSYVPPLVKKDKRYKIYLSEGEEEATAVTKVSFQLVYRYPERNTPDEKSETVKAENDEEEPIPLRAREQVFSLGIEDRNVIPDEVTGYPVKKDARVTITQFVEQKFLASLFTNFGFPDYLNIKAMPISDNLLNITYNIDSFHCREPLKNLNFQTSIKFAFDIDELTKYSRKDTDPELDSQPMLGTLPIFTYNNEKCTSDRILEIVRQAMNKSLEEKSVEVILPLDTKTGESTEILEILEWGAFSPKMKVRKNFLGLPVVLECVAKGPNDSDWDFTINNEDTEEQLSQKLEEIVTTRVKVIFERLSNKKDLWITVDELDFRLSEHKIRGKFLIDLNEDGHSSLNFTWDIDKNDIDEDTRVELAGLFLSMADGTLKLHEKLANILKGLPIKVWDISFNSEKTEEAGVRNVFLQFNLNVNDELILNHLLMTGKINVTDLMSGVVNFSDVDFDFSNVTADGPLNNLLSKFISLNDCISFTDTCFIKEGIQFNVEASFPFMNGEKCSFCQVTITKDGPKFGVNGESIEDFLNNKVNEFISSYPHVCRDGQIYLHSSTFEDSSGTRKAIQIVLKKDGNNVAWPLKFEHIYVHAIVNEKKERFDVLDPKGCAFTLANNAISNVKEKIRDQFQKEVLEPLKKLLKADVAEINEIEGKSNAAILSLIWKDNNSKPVSLSMVVTAGVSCKDQAIVLEKPQFSDFKLEDPQCVLSGKLNNILPTDFFKIGRIAILDQQLTIPFVFKNEEITNGEEINIGSLCLTFEQNNPQFRFKGTPGKLVDILQDKIQENVLNFLKSHSLDKFGPISVTGISPEFKWIENENRLKTNGFLIKGNISYFKYNLPCQLTWENKKFNLKVEKDSLGTCLQGVLKNVTGLDISYQPINGNYKNGISVSAKGEYKILKKNFKIEIRNLCIRPNSLQFPEMINFTCPISNLHIPVGSVDLVLYEMNISANFPDQSKFSSLKIGIGAAMTAYAEVVGKTLKFNSQITIPFMSPLKVTLTSSLVLLNHLQVVSGNGELDLINFKLHLEVAIGGCFGKFFSGKSTLDMGIENQAFTLKIDSSLQALGHEFGSVKVNLRIDMKHLTDSKFEVSQRFNFNIVNADTYIYIPLNLKNLEMRASFNVGIDSFELAKASIFISLRRLKLEASVLGIGFSIKLAKFDRLTTKRILEKIKSLFKIHFSFSSSHHKSNPDADDDDVPGGEGTGTGGGKGTIPNNGTGPNTGGQNTGNTKTEIKVSESKVRAIPMPPNKESWTFDVNKKKFTVYDVKTKEIIPKREIWYEIPADINRDIGVPQEEGIVDMVSMFRIEGGKIFIWEHPYADKLERLQECLVKPYIKDGKIYGKMWSRNEDGSISCNDHCEMKNSNLDFLKSSQEVDLSWANNLNNFLNVGEECSKTWKNQDKNTRRLATTYGIQLMIAAQFLGVKVQRVEDDPPLYTWELGGKYFLANNWDAIVIPAPYDKNATEIQKKTWKKYLELTIDKHSSKFFEWLKDKASERIVEFSFKENMWENAPAFGYIVCEKEKEKEKFYEGQIFPVDSVDIKIDSPQNSEYFAAAYGYKEFKPLKNTTIKEDSKNSKNTFAVVLDNNKVVSYFRKHEGDMKCIELDPPLEWNDNCSCEKTLWEIFNQKYPHNQTVKAYRVKKSNDFKGGYVLVKGPEQDKYEYAFIADITDETKDNNNINYSLQMGKLPPQWSPFASDNKTISNEKLHLLQIFQKNVTNMEYLIYKNPTFYCVAKWKEGGKDEQNFLIVDGDGITVVLLKDYYAWASDTPPENQEAYHWAGFKGLDNSSDNGSDNSSNNVYTSLKNASLIYLGKTKDLEGEVVRIVWEEKDSNNITLFLSNNEKNASLSIDKDKLENSFEVWPYTQDKNFEEYLKCLVWPDQEWKKYLHQSPTFFFRKAVNSGQITQP